MLSPTGKNVMDLLRLRESESDSKGQECRRHRQPAARLPRRDRRSAHNSDRRPSSGNPKTWQKKFVHPDGSCFALLCSALLFFALLCSCRIGQSANRPVGQSAGAICGSVSLYMYIYIYIYIYTDTDGSIFALLCFALLCKNRRAKFT